LPDDYELKVEASGFKRRLKQSLRLEVGQKLAVDITLRVGTLTQGVNVTAGSEVLQTTGASVGEVVEPTSIRELPLNGRMLIDLVLTVPGAHIGFGAQNGIHESSLLASGSALPPWSSVAAVQTRTFSCSTAPQTRIPLSTRRT